MERGNALRRRWTLKNPRKLFSTGDPQPSIPEEGEGDTGRPLALRQRSHTIHHSRTLSDISEHHALPGEEDSSSPSLTPSGTVSAVALPTHCARDNYESNTYSDPSPWRRGASHVSISPNSHLLHTCPSLPHCLLLPAGPPPATGSWTHGLY